MEETIERIKVQPGVEGYVICNKQGQVLTYIDFDIDTNIDMDIDMEAFNSHAL